MRIFFEMAVEDMVAGRESWRVITLLSSAALAITGIFFLW